MRWAFLTGLLAVLAPIGVQDVWAIRVYDNGRWSGLGENNSILMFWVQNTQLTILRLVAMNACNARSDGRYTEYQVSLGKDALGDAPPFYVEANGHVEGGFRIEQGVYKGLTVHLRGDIRDRSGQIVVTLSSSTDLDNCAKSSIVPVKWISAQNL
jgi:hypothetical protein